MKKVVILAAATVLGMGMVAPAASAQDRESMVREIRCGANVLGPEAKVDCDIESEVTVTCDNDNEITIGNVTEQDADSGETKVTFNTKAGDAFSGQAVNINSSDFNVAVENACEVEDKAEESEKPDNGGGQGAGSVEQDNSKDEDNNQVGGLGAGAPQDNGGIGAGATSGFGAGVASLPETSGTSPLTYASIIALAAGAIAIAARFATAAYSRFNA